jgi:AcrR family transcriptional regulator
MDLRQTILDAAAEVMGEKGFAGTSIRAVAARAGVATGTVYLYFPDKRGLLLVLAEELGRQLQEVAGRPARSAGEAFERLLSAQARFLRAHRRLLQALVGMAWFDQAMAAALRKHVFAPLREQLRTLLQACGAEEPAALAAGAQAVLVMNAVLAPLLGSVQPGKALQEEIVRRVGVRARRRQAQRPGEAQAARERVSGSQRRK